MKLLKKILLSIVIILALASLLAVLTGHSHLFKAVSTTYLVGKTGPGIDDYVYFENRKVAFNKDEPNSKINYYHFVIKEYKLTNDKIEKLAETLETIINDDFSKVMIEINNFLYPKYNS